MSQSFWELTRLFLKLGTVSFGGPVAHIALMQDEVVHRRQWLSRDQFLDLWSATNLIPGPNALKVATYIGYRRAGLAGAVTAAVSFTLPGASLTVALAWIYQACRQVPQAKAFLHGIQPAALAIIAVAAYRLGKTAFKDWRTGLIGLSAVAGAWAGLRDIAVLLAAGVLGAVFLRLTERRAAAPPAAPLGAWAIWAAAGGGARVSLPAAAVVAASAVAVPVWKLALFFLEVGAVLYGTGYILGAYLQGGLVDQYGWLAQQELNDAIAVGQVTPGPLITSATFVGYLLSGPWGAVAATVAIVLPGFVLVILLNRWIDRLRAWPWSARFLDAVNAAAIGLIVWLIGNMALSSLVDWQSWFIAAIVALTVFLWKAPLAFLVLGGGLAGMLLG
jgi:chromate transporter